MTAGAPAGPKPTYAIRVVPAAGAPPALRTAATLPPARPPPGFGAAPPPMPPYVQAAFAAARQDVTTAARAYGYAPPPPSMQFGAVPPPAQPPMVRLADEAARTARYPYEKPYPYNTAYPHPTDPYHTSTGYQYSSKGLGLGGMAGPSGLLTSWEQEAELLRSMHDATGPHHPPAPPTGIFSAAPTHTRSDAANVYSRFAQEATVPPMRAATRRTPTSRRPRMPRTPPRPPPPPPSRHTITIRSRREHSACVRCRRGRCRRRA